VHSIFTSLIQSDFAANGHGNFEAVIKVGNDLLHYWRDNSDDARQWKPGLPVCQGNVAFPGAIIQSDFKSDDHGNFEVLVPLWMPTQHAQLWHFFHDNGDIGSAWVRARHPVTDDRDQVVGPASFIQSDFQNDEHGNLDAVVPLMGPHGHTELWHFWHDSTNVDTKWHRARRITGEADQVAGPASIIQSDFRDGEHGNFEVIVPLIGRHGHATLCHFFRDNSNVDNVWVRAQQITGEWDRVAGGGVIIQGDLGDGPHGNFEVVVPLKMPNGHTELWHFFHESDPGTLWRRGQMITASAGGGACIIRSDFGPDEHRDFEVLVDECKESVVHYWRLNQDVNDPWLRGGVLVDRARLTGEKPAAWLPGTTKIVQISGDEDRQGWGGPQSGPPKPAHNQTESRFGIRGLDLGASFLHKNRIYFLFGDTIRTPFRAEDENLDSIAFCTDPNPDDGLDLTFYKDPPRIRNEAFSQRGFEVPLDGVSHRGAMFVFFSTDNRMVGHMDVMGRSVVASSANDGYDFTYLYDFSREKFINVSIEVVDGTTVGLRSYGKTLLIWGSGRYRSSDVYLAAMPLEEIASGRFVRYYAGQRAGEPFWDWRESEAVPLFCAGCVGELCVRWNPFLKRWLMLYNGDNPRGIIMRLAENPWGDWSEQILAFDPWTNGGYGRFMHIPWNHPGNPHDFVHDDLIHSSRENEWAGEYGPYQIAPLARGVEGHFTQIYFLLSTWNPYQVMLMTTTVMTNRSRASWISDILTHPEGAFGLHK